MLAKAGLSLLPTAVSCEQGEYFQPKHGKHCQDVGLALGDFPVTIFFHAVSSMGSWGGFLCVDCRLADGLVRRTTLTPSRTCPAACRA